MIFLWRELDYNCIFFFLKESDRIRGIIYEKRRVEEMIDRERSADNIDLIKFG